MNHSQVNGITMEKDGKEEEITTFQYEYLDQNFREIYDSGQTKIKYIQHKQITLKKIHHENYQTSHYLYDFVFYENNGTKRTVS